MKKAAIRSKRPDIQAVDSTMAGCTRYRDAASQPRKSGDELPISRAMRRQTRKTSKTLQIKIMTLTVCEITGDCQSRLNSAYMVRKTSGLRYEVPGNTGSESRLHESGSLTSAVLSRKRRESSQT